MKKCVILVLCVFLVGFSVREGSADPLYDDVESFIKNNPDGGKYGFVKNYLVALMYFQKNKSRQEKLPQIDLQNLRDSESVKPFIDSLIKDNVNLRIARNLVKKYHAPQNGLILKTAGIFIKVCDEQIEYNSYERALFEKIYEYQSSGQYDDFNSDSFIEAQKLLGDQRRESLKGLLESSMLVNIVLVSPQTDAYGDFYSLGVSDIERQKLLYKIDDFEGKGFAGGIREGQSFLEGSINIIRQILENESWESLEEIHSVKIR